MRISDWSSDVCSSDLPHQQRHRRQWIGERHWFGRFALGGLNREMIMRGVLAGLARSEAGAVAPTVALSLFGLIDRKSVVEGKSVSVRVDLGGCRIIKKKKKMIEQSRYTFIMKH